MSFLDIMVLDFGLNAQAEHNVTKSVKHEKVGHILTVAFSCSSLGTTAFQE